LVVDFYRLFLFLFSLITQLYPYVQYLSTMVCDAVNVKYRAKLGALSPCQKPTQKLKLTSYLLTMYIPRGTLLS